MKVRIFTTRLLQLNAHLAYFPPDSSGQSVNPLPEDEVKEILYHTMPNMWKKKMVEQGYNYIDGSIQNMTEFFETRIANLERFDSKKDSNKEKINNKANKKGKHSNNNVSDRKNSQGTETGKKYCQYQCTCGHSTNECTLVKPLVHKEKMKKQKSSKERKYTKHEVNILVERNMKKALKKRKKQCEEEFRAFKSMNVSDSDEESNNVILWL